MVVFCDRPISSLSQRPLIRRQMSSWRQLIWKKFFVCAPLLRSTGKYVVPLSIQASKQSAEDKVIASYTPLKTVLINTHSLEDYWLINTFFGRLLIDWHVLWKTADWSIDCDTEKPKKFLCCQSRPSTSRRAFHRFNNSIGWLIGCYQLLCLLCWVSIASLVWNLKWLRDKSNLIPHSQMLLFIFDGDTGRISI